LINENFGAGFSSQVDYAFSIIAGDSKEPKKVKEIILDYIEKSPTSFILILQGAQPNYSGIIKFIFTPITSLTTIYIFFSEEYAW
ncbi:EF-P 5-aminopentanol modification-associated protein YfmH, partial [Clostridioides difficile]